MRKKIISVMISIGLLSTILAGCSSAATATSVITTENSSMVADTSSKDATPAATGSEEQVVLEYWTWFPGNDQFAETIANFEAENPNIKINLTVMDSKDFQQRVPLALATEENIDIIGVQPTAFATEISDYLAELDPLLQTAAGSDWASAYSEVGIAKSKSLTGDSLKFLAMFNSGSMIGYYNVALLDELGMKVPTTLAEYKTVADALYEKYPDKYAGVFAGQDSWVMDEMMLTVLGQKGDYYDKWRYEGASVDSSEYITAMSGLKAFFDEGVFSSDLLDIDYARASEIFAAGDALVYYMGSWEAPLLSSVLREQNGVALEDVSVMALPTVDAGDTLTVRSYLDAGIGIVSYSNKQEAAAKFIAYCTVGDGVNALAKQFLGTPGKMDFEMDKSMLTSESAIAGWDRLVELLNTATADRNNVSGYSDIEGAAVQSVILGTTTPIDAAASLQKEWTSGKY